MKFIVFGNKGVYVYFCPRSSISTKLFWRFFRLKFTVLVLNSGGQMDVIFLCEINNMGKNNPVFFLWKKWGCTFSTKAGEKNIAVFTHSLLFSGYHARSNFSWEKITVPIPTDRYLNNSKRFLQSTETAYYIRKRGK